jgi:hypothetical protein
VCGGRGVHGETQAGECIEMLWAGLAGLNSIHTLAFGLEPLEAHMFSATTQTYQEGHMNGLQLARAGHQLMCQLYDSLP